MEGTNVMPEITEAPTPQPRIRARRQGPNGRKHLTPQEAEALIKAAGGLTPHGPRNKAMLLLAYRHGLRVSELVGLTWDQVDLASGHIHVSRAKGSLPGVHPLTGPEIRTLRQLRRDWPQGRHLFQGRPGIPLDPSSVNRMVDRAAKAAGVPFNVHPHMLRHACGYALAAQGADTRLIQDYLGHRNIQNTVIYTRLAPGRFNGLWNESK